MSQMPVAFVGHGAPTLALDAKKGADFATWGASMPRPGAILVVSAHWQTAGATLGTVTPRPLMYDFSGFPEPLYRVRYTSPGAPELAQRIAAVMVAHGGVTTRPERPLDHGVWTPLVHLFPKADVPVLQLSLPRVTPRALFELGAALAPLRAEGVWLMGSGNVTHNLGRARPVDDAAPPPPPTWASEFDAFVAENVSKGDFDALIDFEKRAPGAAMSHPTHEHYLPLLWALGAASRGSHRARFPVLGYEFHSLSRRCVELA